MSKPRIPSNKELGETLAELNAQADERAAAKRIASACLDAITTTSTSNGSRAVAHCGALRTYVAWDHRLDTPGNHARAALRMLQELGKAGSHTLAMVCIRPGCEYVFVLVPRSG